MPVNASRQVAGREKAENQINLRITPHHSSDALRPGNWPWPSGSDVVLDIYRLRSNVLSRGGGAIPWLVCRSRRSSNPQVVPPYTFAFSWGPTGRPSTQATAFSPKALPLPGPKG